MKRFAFLSRKHPPRARPCVMVNCVHGTSSFKKGREVDTIHLIPVIAASVAAIGIRWAEAKGRPGLSAPSALSAPGCRICFNPRAHRAPAAHGALRSGLATDPRGQPATTALQPLLKPWSRLPWTVSSMVQTALHHVLFGSVAPSLESQRLTRFVFAGKKMTGNGASLRAWLGRKWPRPKRGNPRRHRCTSCRPPHAPGRFLRWSPDPPSCAELIPARNPNAEKRQ